MIPKYDDLVPSIRGPPVRSKEKRPATAAGSVQAVRYNIDFSASTLQQQIQCSLVMGEGSSDKRAPTPPHAIQNLRVCTFERTAECASPPARLRPVETPAIIDGQTEKRLAKRAREREEARHLTRYTVADGAQGAQAVTVPVSEFEELQCLLLFLPQSAPTEPEATAGMTTSARTAEIVPLAQPLYLLRGERTHDAATTGGGISDAWQEVHQPSTTRFNKRDWKTMDELDALGEDTGGYATRGKVNADVGGYSEQDAEGGGPRPRGGGVAGKTKAAPVDAKSVKKTVALSNSTAPTVEKVLQGATPSSGLVDISSSLLDPAPQPTASATATVSTTAAPSEPPRKVLKLGEALRKTGPAPTPPPPTTITRGANDASLPPVRKENHPTAPVPATGATPKVDEAADAAALSTIAAAHIEALVVSTSSPAAPVVVPLRELEQKVLKQLPSYPAVAAMFKSRSEAGAATAWFKGLRAQLHLYLKNHKYNIDPKDNVILTRP